MRSHLAATALAAAALAAAATLATAEDPPPRAAPPPTTPLPAHEDPLFDAVVGETCLYVVRDLDGTRPRWFEERVIARTADRVLVETVVTDATGEKDFGLYAGGTAWFDVAKEFPKEPFPGASWKTADQRGEVVYAGPDDAKKGVRCTRRVLVSPDPAQPKKPPKETQTWYSHDVPGRGIAKRFPSHGESERRAVSWEKKLSAEQCAKRAGQHPTAEEEEKKRKEAAAMSEPGMDAPAMDPPPMDDPSMG